MTVYYVDFWLAEDDYKNGEPAVDTLLLGTDAQNCQETADELKRDSGCFVKLRTEENGNDKF